MDPWLEHPGLWPDVHKSLIAAIRDDLAPRIAPRYYVGVEQHTYVTTARSNPAGIRSDMLTGRSRSLGHAAESGAPVTGPVVLDVEVPVEVTVDEWYLEIRTAEKGKLVTVIEILSPTTKPPGLGRKEYLKKRKHVLKTRTSLIEIDLLRGGRPMPLATRYPVRSDYRILVSRGSTRPRAGLYAFGVRPPIPTIPIPLRPKDPEPSLDLNAVLHALYERARFDLRLDYTRPPVPPLPEEVAVWAREILSGG
jgi:hypothetical protein